MRTFGMYQKLRTVLRYALPACLAVQMAAGGENAASSHPIQAKPVEHDIVIGGHDIDYAAAAGFIPVGDAAKGTAAKIFYISYTAENRDKSKPRPVIFLFNGGPGAASIYLNLGGIGPKQVVTRAPQAATPAPYRLADSDISLIDKADLVFLDAVGTGYSRADDPEKDAAYWSVDADTRSFAQAITRYVTKYKRWNSPKYLFGESYGATRAAALAYVLEKNGLALNGVILMSPILNFALYEPGIGQGFVNTLPSLAATAWYHHKLKDAPADLAQFERTVRRFALERYLPALQLGDRISAGEKASVAAEMSRYIGLPAATIEKYNLRISVDRFCMELLGNGRAVGVLDTRAEAAMRPGTGLEFDPADQAINAPYTAAFHRILAEQLKTETDRDYIVSVPGLDWRWDWHHAAPDGTELTTPDMGRDLAAAIRLDPHLKVLSLHGYFDLSTPFFGAEYDFAHMKLPAGLTGNIRQTYYPSGHMIYLNPDVHPRLKADLDAFIDETAVQQ